MIFASQCERKFSRALGADPRSVVALARRGLIEGDDVERGYRITDSGREALPK